MNEPAKIPVVRLGDDGPEIGAQGLGCMGMSDFYGATDDAKSLATLNHAVDRGVTLIDTADMYGRGRNEELIARILRTRRAEIVIATKFGIVRKADDPNYFGVDNSPAYIAACADASLRRLGVDVIDVYYMHRRDRNVPLAESIGAMADLVRAGKVRYLGLSEVSAEELREACAIHPITVIQSEWSLFSRDVEDSVVPAAVELGMGFVAYSPLGRGMLTNMKPEAAAADPSDVRNYLPRFVGANGQANAKLVATLCRLAAERGVTAAQMALAWVHSRSAHWGVTVVPIPGTRSMARIDENLEALTIALTGDELSALGGLSAEVAGARPV